MRICSLGKQIPFFYPDGSSDDNQLQSQSRQIINANFANNSYQESNVVINLKDLEQFHNYGITKI